MLSFRQTHANDYEEKFESILKENTFFNELNRELAHFHLTPTFERAARQLIIETSEKQLFKLAELRKQIDDFNKQHQTSIIKSSAAVDRSFDHYKEHQEKYRMEFVNLFLHHFSEYFTETNPLSKDLLDHLKTRIPLQLAELSIEGNPEDQLNANIQLLETHVPLTIDFKHALEVFKKAYLIDPEISQFIFIAREEAFLLLKNRIKNHLLHQNFELAKTDYDSLHALFFQFYRETLISLVNYYQDYKNITQVFQQKFDILDDVGEPTKNWLTRYQQLSNRTTFFSERTSQRLKSICDELSTFKKQIQLENPNKFLQQIKNKTQQFLDTKIQLLNQEFQEYRDGLVELASSFKLSQHEIDKLLAAKQSYCLTLQEKWVARKNRLQLINNVEDLKNFKQHFPKEKLFPQSLDLEKQTFSSAFTLLDNAIFIDKNEHLNLASSVTKISESDLAKKVIDILESIDTDKQPHAIKNLLQFIYSENSNPIFNEAKKHLVNALKDFFISQNEKTAFCMAKVVDNVYSNVEAHEHLLNYLRLIDIPELQKINAAHKKERTEDEVLDIQKLILTKETLNLLGENRTHKTVWDACLFFQKLYTPSPRCNQTTLPYLNKTNTLPFLEAIESLNTLLRILTRTKKSPYLSNFFLTSNKQKQALIENLVHDLKNTPISQVDTQYINDFFEKWRNEHEHIINKPRYRLLIGVFMLIFTHIKKLFSHSSLETTSCQTVEELQRFFSSAYEDLEKIKLAFDPFSSKLNQNLSAESEKSLARSL